MKCILGKKGESIGIGNLERFAADWERDHNVIELPPVKPPNGRKVAVIGSGPAGLTVAGELIKEGFEVVVFEALHEPGGVLVYGIPEFRLPKEIVKKEIEYLQRMGVKIEKNVVVGKTITIDELFEEEGFDAVFVGSGAGLPAFMGIPGENSIGVYSANEYLTRSNLMKAYEPGSNTPILRGRRVATVGGGNVAMDSARTALRLGAERSIIVYRRSETEMPARLAEIHHAKEEGIEFHLLCNPVEILTDEKHFVRALRCIRMELGEPDSSGRRRPVPVPGSEFEIECDVVVIAIGNKPNPLIPSTTKQLEVSKWGTIIANEQDGRTSMQRVYAGGDIVTGAATVILAMGAGRNAAQTITQDLLEPEDESQAAKKDEPPEGKPSKPGVHANRVVEDRTANEASFAQCADSPRERRLAPNLDCFGDNPRTAQKTLRLRFCSARRPDWLFPALRQRTSNSTASNCFSAASWRTKRCFPGLGTHLTIFPSSANRAPFRTQLMLSPGELASKRTICESRGISGSTARRLPVGG